MTAIDDLPPLRETIRRHGLSAKKSLGQNFLLDLNLTARIARAGGPLDGISVVEIGPGPGGLTRALIAQGARQVIAIERDRRAIAALGEIAAHYPGRLMVIEGDALEIDWRRMPIPSPAPAPAPSPSLNRSRASPISVEGRVAENATRIIANLPYNIATALLVRWLAVEPWPPWYESLVLMFQREVAERIVALPGTKQYGRLAVLAGWRTEARIMFDVAPSAFVPPPKVTSSVVRLVPRVAPLACTHATIERVTAAAFGQRRKMLRQSLRALDSDPQVILEATGIDPTARAEDIPVEGFVALANAADAMQTHDTRHPKDYPKSLR
jgi:16S rRNA (adenine1518-N6/adenine1519-N6)-dimethyltransferase